MTRTHALQAAWQSELIVYSLCCGRVLLTKTTTKYLTPKDFSRAGTCARVRVREDTCTRREGEALGSLRSCLRVSLLEWYHIPQPCLPHSAVQDNNVVETLCLWGEGFKSIILRLGILPGGRDRSEVLLRFSFFRQ